MKDEGSRGAFEAWAATHMRGVLKPESRMELGGDSRTAYYKDAATSWAWTAWQAALSTQAAGGVAKEGWKHVRVALQLLESETASIGLTIGTQSAIAELQRALRDGATASPPPPSTGVSSGGQQALIEHIAQQWDDCTFDTPGEAINIGEAIRAAAKRYLGSQGECAASGAEGVSLRLLTDAEAGYCECNSFDATAREIQREFCKANGLTVPDTKEGGNV